MTAQSGRAPGPGGGRDLHADEADLLTTTEAAGRIRAEAAAIRARLELHREQGGRRPDLGELEADRLRLAELEAAMARYRPSGA
ncbi:MAG: hypothetical protein AB1679_04475 [Actinomycetota bacterium]